MSLRSKLQVENVGLFAALVFYAIAGVICFAMLVIDLRLVHIGIIGILSLITAYGLFKKQVWAFWLVVMLFFIITTFSAYTLYYVIWKNLILDISLIAYLVLTWVFTVYTAAKRKIFTS